MNGKVGARPIEAAGRRVGGADARVTPHRVDDVGVAATLLESVVVKDTTVLGAGEPAAGGGNIMNPGKVLPE